LIESDRTRVCANDQLGRQVEFLFPPKRIISLVPSQTELLFDLGLDKEVIGITKFCVHPSNWLQSKTVVGGTKNFWFEKITKLNPDLIIGNKEENYKEGIDLLCEKYPVWLSDVTKFEEAIEMILSIGKLTNREEISYSLSSKIQSDFWDLHPKSHKRVLYLIWKNPWMAAGTTTFINSMLEKIGFINCISEPRYPIISEEQIKWLNPEIIFLSSEPYPFRQNHLKELLSINSTSHVSLVDGEYFSWFGSRMVHAPAYFKQFSAIL
jgi:ABC-type Fe3+-hydroxamate transport system substrate-binding protein